MNASSARIAVNRPAHKGSADKGDRASSRGQAAPATADGAPAACEARMTSGQYLFFFIVPPVSPQNNATAIVENAGRSGSFLEIIDQGQHLQASCHGTGRCRCRCRCSGKLVGKFSAGQVLEKAANSPEDTDAAQQGGGGNAQYCLKLVVIEMVVICLSNKTCISHGRVFFLHDASPESPSQRYC